MLPEQYAFETERSLTTVIGVGEQGIAALDELYKQAIKDTQFWICGHQADTITASSVPGKVWFPADVLSDEGAFQKQVDSLTGSLPDYGNVLVIADLAEVDCHALVSGLLRAISEKEQKPIPVVVLPNQDVAGTDTLLTYLQRHSYGILPVKRTAATDDSVLVETTRFLLELITNYHDTADFADIMYLSKPGGQVLFFQASGQGEERANQAVSGLLTQQVQAGIASAQLQRLLVAISTDDTNPLLFREQVAIGKGLLVDGMQLSKIVVTTARWQEKRLTVKALGWLAK